MIRLGILGVLLAVPLLAPPPVGGAGEETPKVTVKVVNYAGLGEVIRSLRGKVVVVDFWGDY